MRLVLWVTLVLFSALGAANQTPEALWKVVTTSGEGAIHASAVQAALFRLKETGQFNGAQKEKSLQVLSDLLENDGRFTGKTVIVQFLLDWGDPEGLELVTLPFRQPGESEALRRFWKTLAALIGGSNRLPALVPELRDILADRGLSPFARAAVGHLLLGRDGADAAKWVTTLMESRHEPDRLVATLLLQVFPLPFQLKGMIGFLKGGLEKGEEPVASAAATALANHGYFYQGNADPKFLAKLIQAKSPVVQSYGIDVAVKAGDNSLVKHLPGLFKGQPSDDAYVLWSKVAKTLETHPAWAAQVMPELQKLFLDPQVDDQARYHIAHLMGEAGGEPEIATLTEALKSAKQSSPLFLKAADALGKLVGKHTKAGTVDPKVSALLEGGMPEVSLVQRYLRKALPPGHRVAYDTAYAKAAISKLKLEADACKAVCRLTELASTWGAPKSQVVPDSYFNYDAPYFSWEFATKSLGALFLVRALPYCKGGAAPKELNRILGEWLKSGNAATGRESEKDAEDAKQKEFFDALKKAGIDPETTAKVKAFYKKSGGMSSAKSPPKNSVTVYGRIFFATLVDALKKEPEIAKLVPKAKDALAADLAKYTEIPVEATSPGGSLMTTHLLSAAVIAGKKGAPFVDNAVTGLNGVLQKILDKNGDTNAIPYFPGTRPEAPPTARSGGARAVVFHLALYEKDTGPKNREKHRTHLIESLRNYRAMALELLLLTGNGPFPYGETGQSLHDHKDANLAPYYGPSTIPYATAAIVRLLADPKLTPEERTELEEIRDDLQLRLLATLQPNGLFREGNPKTYQSAVAYNNPLIGLALLSTVRQCGGQNVPPSPGIMPHPEAPPAVVPEESPPGKIH